MQLHGCGQHFNKSLWIIAKLYFPTSCFKQKHPTLKVQSATQHSFSYSSSTAIKYMQVADCCMCRWFWGSINLCQQHNNADIPYWDTSWVEEAHERGSSLNQIKACVFLKSEKQHPGEDAVGMKLYTSRRLHCLHFLHITVVEMLLSIIR